MKETVSERFRHLPKKYLPDAASHLSFLTISWGGKKGAVHDLLSTWELALSRSKPRKITWLSTERHYAPI